MSEDDVDDYAWGLTYRLIANPLSKPPATVPSVITRSLMATLVLESPTVTLKYRGTEV
jgi:hypothetical protein